MKRTSLAILLAGATLLALTACDTTPNRTDLSNAHYWQRAETSSAIYQRGPKAQQMLHRDIAQCTYEVRELVRLGTIRKAVPASADKNGNMPDPATPEGRLADWDTPERDGYLLTEHSDFHDFETCMMTKGWERVENLPYEIAEEAREVYSATILGQQRRSRNGELAPMTQEEEGDFAGLNQ